MPGASTLPLPVIMPLGDSGLLVRFADSLSEPANAAALGFAREAEAAGLPGVVEIVPNLVSVLLRYDPRQIGFDRLAGEVRLLVGGEQPEVSGAEHRIEVRYDGEDLAEVCDLLGLTEAAFVAAHGATPLRVLAVGFAPGFLYCGFHPPELHLPRRSTVRPPVPAGTVLFAAGQTAVAATPIPTGWHVIGHTDLRNFDAGAQPPVTVLAGDRVTFEAAS
jgi:KipI family sensor histidine kinase inhibitor